MASIQIDLATDPIVVVTFDGVATDAEFDAYLTQMTGLLQRRKTMVTIFDGTRAGATPATQRRKQAAWMEDQEAMLRRYSAGSAFIITNALVRGVLTAIFWMRPMPVPHTIVSNRADAEAWAKSRLASRIGLESAP